MAGLNLILKASNKIENIKEISEFVPHILSHKNIWNNNEFTMSFHTHNGYPHTLYSNNNFDVFVEGKIYNLDEEELKKELDSLFIELNKEQIEKEAISKILFKLDGDYILVLHNKIKNTLYLLNDIYGRLPIYYGKTNEFFMISRNQDVLSNTLNLKEVDIYGIAEYLVFGCTVTERTLIGGINYFLPGSLLSFDINTKKYFIENIFTYNFEELLSVSKSNYKEKLKENINLFKDAVSQRTTEKSVVGLSGGLDSRILAAALKDVDKNVEAVSRMSFNNRENIDVMLAEKVSQVINIPFNIIKSQEPEDSFLNEIIILKSGLNSIENDYNLIFEKKLQLHYGSEFTYFTGDAGDRIKPHIQIQNAKNLPDFVDKLIAVNSRVGLKDVSRLLNINQKEFKKNIEEYIKTFPENSFAHKDLHFRIYNRGFKYVVEGEDRKRNFFWTAMPFYGHQFFLSAMSFPDYFKKDHKMFLDFMNLLEPSLSDIVNKNWGLKPSDWRLPIYFIRYKVSRGIKQRINSILQLIKKDSNRLIFGDKDFYLIENDIFDIKVYEELLESYCSNRSRYYFLNTPLLLKKHLSTK